MARRAAKGAPTKGETITIRVDPRTKFALDIVSRLQHRSLSAVIEMACYQVIDETLAQGKGQNTLLEDIWHPVESQRLARIAVLHPRLLTYEEELLWNEIKDIPGFWQSQPDAVSLNKSIKSKGWDYVETELIFNFLEGHWEPLIEELKKPKPFNIQDKMYEQFRIDIAKSRSKLDKWDTFFEPAKQAEREGKTKP